MRRKKGIKKTYRPDIVYNSPLVTKFINHLMEAGKKAVARKIMYEALLKLEKETKIPALEVFDTALKNIMPAVEVRSKRIGGANYQVPQPVRPERKLTLAFRWIIEASRKKKGKPMADKLFEELLAAFKKEGAAYKKKEDTLKMAEANRAFAHFAWK